MSDTSDSSISFSPVVKHFLENDVLICLGFWSRIIVTDIFSEDVMAYGIVRKVELYLNFFQITIIQNKTTDYYVVSSVLDTQPTV